MSKKKKKIAIPKALDDVVNQAIYDGLSLLPKKRNYAKVVSCCFISFFAVFVTLLNTIPVFAKTMFELDVIGDICKIFTFREYHFQEEFEYIDVWIPHIDLGQDNDLENRVNLEISKIIDEEVTNAKIRVKEYYDAFVATGGDPEEFQPIYVKIDYEIKQLSTNVVSFIINKSETLASAYNTQYYYNIDLETSRIFTLRDWFGNDYKKIIAEAINKQLMKMSEEQREMFLIETSIENYIDEDQEFYINKKNQVVVVFPKYEVAVGALGTLEFVIEGE